jgi:hypothetical protein
MAVENTSTGTELTLRDSLEAAITQVEAPSQEPAQSTGTDLIVRDEGSAPVREERDENTNVIDLNKPVEENVSKLTEKKVTAPAQQIEPAPKAWKASARAAWDKLPPDVRQEVQRRENEVARVFGETGQMRQAVQTFNQIIAPYQARMNAVGLEPLEAVAELLKADHILSSAPTIQRAQYMAKLIQEYGVDIRALDDALAGVAPTDPVESRLEQMLAERLTPIQQFLQNQNQIAAQQEFRVQQEAAVSIEQMALDNIKYPHFEQVRDDMADIIEMNAKRRVYLTPEQAYQRAVAMNPEWSAQAAQQLNQSRQLTQAQAANAKAQRALNASGSVSGGPSGTPIGGVNQGSSLRDTIEAAFSQVAGR